MTGNLAIPAGCRIVLICEGRGDAAFLAAMARHLKVDNARAIPVMGSPNFRDQVEAVSNIENFEGVRAFGIVRDADDSPARTLAEINGVMRDFFGAGANFLKHGEVKRPESGEFSTVSFGAFITPDGQRGGELEDLLLESARESHPQIMDCVGKFLDCANPDGKPKKESKKAVQALISGFPEYCEDLNVVLKKKLVNLDDGAFAGLREFLRKLADAANA